MNGGVQLEGGFVVGAMATYICRSGFELIGEPTRTCTLTMEWSGVEPMCGTWCELLSISALAWPHVEEEKGIKDSLFINLGVSS